MASTPIADLSYRNYDGPLEAPTMRWWVVAKMSIRLATKKRGFWIWSSLAAYWYLVLGAIFYFVDVLADQASSNGGPNFSSGFFSSVVWKDKFLDAFSIGKLLLLIVALLVGIGSIANDNRANALLVYLSKPCTKFDYLFGKWMSIFLLILAVTAAPALLFFAYCFMSFRQYGFVSQDPHFFWRLLIMLPLPAVLHASLCVGISSMFNQPRMAGATYSGIYFMSLFFTWAMKIINAISMERTFTAGRHGHRHVEFHQVPSIVQSLFYCSVDGIQIGLAKVLLGTNGTPIFPGGPPVPPAPNGWIFGGIYVGICALSIFIAWTRVRAVEVVRG